MKRLSGARAVITGSGRGIGRAIAIAYAREGAAVVLSARGGHAIAAVATEIIAAGGIAHAVVSDICDDAQVSELARAAQAHLGGPVTVLVNNAGTYLPKRFLDYTMSDWQRVLEVNVLGTVRVTRAFLSSMVQQRHGRIINIASTAGKYGSYWQSAYNVSKHGIVGLTRCLALETGAHGIRVNAICPGFVPTGMISPAQLAPLYGVAEDQVPTLLAQRAPIGRMASTEEIAELAVYLASPAADGMTGQALTLDGGAILV